MPQDRLAHFDSLPKELQERFESTDLSEGIYQIADEHKLSIREIRSIGKAVSTVLLRLGTLEEFQRELEGMLPPQTRASVVEKIKLLAFRDITHLLKRGDVPAEKLSSTATSAPREIDLTMRQASKPTGQPDPYREPIE